MISISIALALALSHAVSVQGNTNTIVLSSSPINASAPIPEAYVSYSIEFSSFPDFAGMLSHAYRALLSDINQETIQHQMSSPTIC